MWYYAFTAAVFLLWLGARPKDRDALAVVALATLASALLVDLWTAHYTSPLKLAVPATVETITAVLLLRWATGETAIFQAVLVTVAWWLHYLCFTDLIYNANVVYDNYEVFLTAVSVAQLIAFHDTYLHHFRRWWSYLGAGGAGVLRAPRGAVSVSPGSGANRVEEVAP